MCNDDTQGTENSNEPRTIVHSNLFAKVAQLSIIKVLCFQKKLGEKLANTKARI